MSSKRNGLIMLLLIGLAFSASTLTALRFSALPVGVAEAILILCILLHIPLGNQIYVEGKSNRFVICLAALTLATLPGFVSSIVSGESTTLSIYNFVASLWVLILFCYLQWGFTLKTEQLDWLGLIFVLFSNVYFFTALMLAQFDPELVYHTLTDVAEGQVVEALKPGEEPIKRLYGFAENPNQLGLHAIVALFFALRLFNRLGSVKGSFIVIVTCVTGYLTQSDSFILGAVLMLVTQAILSIFFNRSYIAGLVVLLPIVVAAGIFAPSLIAEFHEVTTSGDQDQTRYTLWKNGLAAAEVRPLIGMGPGAWSGYNGPFEDQEAHNSVIDYVASSGVIGGVLLTVVLLGFASGCLKSGQASLCAGAAGIIFFSLFHNTLRQPVMWLSLFYIASMIWGSASSERPRQRGRRRSRRRSAG